VDLTNATLRERCVETANRDVAYLQDQLQKTGVVELQRAISTLLESELKKSMIAQGSKEYAFKVIDPAVPPQRRSSPQRLLIISISVLLGALIGCLRVMLQNRIYRHGE